MLARVIESLQVLADSRRDAGGDGTASGKTSAALSEIAWQVTTEQASRRPPRPSGGDHSVNVAQRRQAAAEEMSASIGEITSQVNASSEMAVGAADDVERSTAAVSNLNGVVERVGDVTRLISEIAAQTNLLALNATIEAARACERRKGLRGRFSLRKSSRSADQTGQGDEDHCASDTDDIARSGPKAFATVQAGIFGIYSVCVADKSGKRA